MKHYKFKDNLTAIILCGGKGTRLYPLTKNTPKPLIKIKNKEILKYILDHLFKAGINNIILATGYKHKSFKNFYLKLIPNLKSKIKVLNTGANNDILKRIAICEKASKDYILICYGDTIVDIDINRLINFFLKDKNNITICSYRLKSQFGVMKLNQKGVVKSFEEKPNLNLYFNIGFFLLPKKKFQLIKKFKSFKSFLENYSSNHVLRSYIHKGNHITVNTLDELNNARKQLNEKK